jgi:hypothetical protein
VLSVFESSENPSEEGKSKPGSRRAALLLLDEKWAFSLGLDDIQS